MKNAWLTLLLVISVLALSFLQHQYTPAALASRSQSAVSASPSSSAAPTPAAATILSFTGGAHPPTTTTTKEEDHFIGIDAVIDPSLWAILLNETQYHDIVPSFLPPSSTTLINSEEERHTTLPTPLATTTVTSAAKGFVCPPPSTFTNKSNDPQARTPEQQPRHILKKYAGYAERCGVMRGSMWAKLSASSVRRIYATYLDLLMGVKQLRTMRAHNATKPPPRPMPSNNDSLVILDWASGCGAGTASLVQRAQGEPWHRPNVTVLGVDITASAVRYAKRHHLIPGHMTYCQGDGTQLDWLPLRTFDFVVAWGALYLLPPKLACSTVWRLLERVKPGGMIITGFVQPRIVAEDLANCTAVVPSWVRVSEEGVGSSSARRETQGMGVRVTKLNERVLLKNCGLHRVYKRPQALTIVWEKVGW